MIFHLTVEEYIDKETGFGCSLFYGPADKCLIHNHEFYEFVITRSSGVVHEVNGERKQLEKNTLLLVRPHDLHRFLDVGQGLFSYVNLAFTKEIYESVGTFLKANNDLRKITLAKKPPYVKLSDTQANEIVGQFLNLMGNAVITNAEMYGRGVVSVLLSSYFIPEFSKLLPPNIPDWLEKICIEMHKKEFFDKKLKELENISGKSYGYICHSFKKYFNTTPTAYLNEIKLNYAENLLCNSNLSVLDVSLECGFENLGHFYELFKKKNKISPRKYRIEQNKKSIIL